MKAYAYDTGISYHIGSVCGGGREEGGGGVVYENNKPIVLLFGGAGVSYTICRTMNPADE